MSTHTRGGREIRTNDLHFIKCGTSRLNYLLGTIYYLYLKTIKTIIIKLKLKRNGVAGHHRWWPATLVEGKGWLWPPQTRVAEATSWPLGVVRPPSRANFFFFFFFFNFFLVLGGGRTTPKGQGVVVASHPISCILFLLFSFWFFFFF
jgi:hypothetical protein